jgi:hypothetical protein
MEKPKSEDTTPADRAPEYNDTLYPSFAKTIASLGVDDQDFANAFNVSLATIAEWEQEHPEFAKARKAGVAALRDNLERAIIRRALGYTVEREKVLQCEGKIEVVSYKEHIPADVSALMFVMMNRKPRRWKHHSKITPQNEPDEFAIFLKSINGNVMRPKEPNS